MPVFYSPVAELDELAENRFKLANITGRDVLLTLLNGRSLDKKL
jgi:hypothetical protein